MMHKPEAESGSEPGAQVLIIPSAASGEVAARSLIYSLSQRALPGRKELRMPNAAGAPEGPGQK